MRTLIHGDLFFKMLIKDDHKTGFLLLDPLLTFTRLFDGEENVSRTWLKEDQFLSLNKIQSSTHPINVPKYRNKTFQKYLFKF